MTSVLRELPLSCSGEERDATLAKSFGLYGEGPIVREGKLALIDTVTQPR
jgi:hypothetical protein